jgi:outer membrane protein assembly factor BamB
MTRYFVCGFVSLMVGCLSKHTSADDWLRFRGPNGSGYCSDAQSLPTSWGETENLKWKIELPGAGSSSPIVVADNVFVTCWSGYGADLRNPGKQENLIRHLVCVDRQTGETRWERSVKAITPEDRFSGMLSEHGFASHTPVSDGKHVYCFYGKTGVVAYDMKGNEVWKKRIGDGLDPQHWGSASSPILYEDKLIVTASAESRSMIALDKETGEEIWKHESDGFQGTWSTPVLVEVEGATELVIIVPYEVWGFDPDSGKKKWHCKSIDSSAACASLVASGGVVYALGGGDESFAIRCGGKGDVSMSHVIWRGKARARVGTPVIHENRLFWSSDNIAFCMDTKMGKEIYRKRLSKKTRSSSVSGSGNRIDGGSNVGSHGGQEYSSMIAGDGKLFYMTRSGVGYALALGDEFEELGQSQFADGGDYSATPAISGNDLFIRSSKSLYCVSGSRYE